MNAIMTHPTKQSLWLALLDDAQAACDQPLEDELKSYLLFVLMRYALETRLGQSVLALEYLQGVQSEGKIRENRLIEVGDKCLLFAGLFPGRAERCRVRISYFIALGQTAYQHLSDIVRGANAALYHKLSRCFVSLMDVLQSMRELNGDAPVLLPLQAMELWSDTGSPRARRILRYYTSAMPVRAQPVCVPVCFRPLREKRFSGLN